jgi:hypothetical protein
MKIRIAKKQTTERPKVTIGPDGKWVGNWPASGVWRGTRGGVLGRLYNFARKHSTW